MALGKVIGLDSGSSWEPNVSVIPSYIHHFGVHDNVTVYVSTNSAGTVTAALSGTHANYYGITKVNDKEFVINRINNKLPTTDLGEVTLTITVAADNTNGYSATTRTVIIGPGSGNTIYANIANATLANNTPAQIQAAINAGIAENIWNVGDVTAPIALNGTVGIKVFNNNTNFKAYILGFNHNADLETGGRKSIHFSLSKNASNQDIAFVDSELYITGSTAAFRMNLVNSNSGGWQYSFMRTAICSAFLDAMDGAWTARIKPVIKYTDNVGGATNNYENVTGTEDKIFLMSEFEIFGTRSYANSYEKSFQQRYDYYAINNVPSARIRGADSAVSNAVSGQVNAGDAVHWWERSPNRIEPLDHWHAGVLILHVHWRGGTYAGHGDEGWYTYRSIGFVPNFVMVAD